MSDLMLDVGLANELKMSFRRNGWTERQIKKMTEGDFLAQVRRVLLNQAEITVFEYVIDCDADPLVPDDWSVEEHKNGGQFTWDICQTALYLSEGQQNNEWIGGFQLRRELAEKRVLNANVLDYLLDNLHLIPEQWKDKKIFFWGTIYRAPNGGGLCVRYLVCDDGEWCWDSGWVDDCWDASDFAAIRAPEAQED